MNVKNVKKDSYKATFAKIHGVEQQSHSINQDKKEPVKSGQTVIKWH